MYLHATPILLVLLSSQTLGFLFLQAQQSLSSQLKFFQPGLFAENDPNAAAPAVVVKVMART